MKIQRIVCFKFKQGVSEEAIARHMTDFAAMQAAIPQIRDYRGGRTCPGDNNRAPDFDAMHYLIFDNMDDIEIYRPHPAHQNFISRNRESWEQVLVLNATIDLP